jgi:hypothetical protein
MKIVILILIGSLVFADSPDGIEVNLRYRKKNNNSVWSPGSSQITIKARGTVIEIVLANDNGSAQIPAQLISKWRAIDLFLTAIGIEETYLTTLTESTPKEIDVYLPRGYKMRLGFAICPKCDRSDKVCQAVYGNDQRVTTRISLNSDTTYSNVVGRKYYMGTCVTNELNPQWYCQRDGIQF